MTIKCLSGNEIKRLWHESQVHASDFRSAFVPESCRKECFEFWELNAELPFGLKNSLLKFASIIFFFRVRVRKPRPLTNPLLYRSPSIFDVVLHLKGP